MAKGKKTVTKAPAKKVGGRGKRVAKATPKVVVIHGKDGVIPEGEYSGRRDLIDIEIAADVEDILDKAFEGCPKLRSVKISGNEKMTIGYEAFANCPSLERVEMPNLKFDESAETLVGGFADDTGDVDFYMPPANAFGGSKKLCNISMVGAGGDYVSIDGVLYSKDKKQLIYCPPGVVEYAIPPFVQEIAWLAFRESCIANLVIPSTVKTIGPMAFENARIGEIRIENGLKEIDANLFNDCDKLRTLVIPNSVTSINDSGEPMFVGCEKLVKVRMPVALKHAYEGTWKYEDVDDECINSKIEYIGADGLPVPYGFVMSGGMPDSQFSGRFPFAFNSLDLANEWLQFAARLAADMATHRLSFTMMQDSYKVVESEYGFAKVDSPDAEIPDYRQTFISTDPLIGEDMQVLSFKPAEMSESQAETVIEFLYPENERPDGDTTPTRVYAQRLLRRLKCSEDVGWNGGFDYFDPSCCYWQDVDLVLPDGITEIAAEEYAEARKLRTVKIPEGVVKIGDGAFYACSELERVEFPSTLREIGLLAFSGCVSLASLELPKGIKKIGEKAFDAKWYDNKKVPQLKDAKARFEKKKKGRK